jgi:drug/metabolite transporter (DMT)-like permease
MKPVWLLALAMLCYALENYVLERFLHKNNALLTMVLLFVMMLPIAGFMLWHQWGQDTGETSRWQMYAAVAVAAVLLFAADWLLFESYRRKANVVEVTTIVMLMPLFAAAIKAIFEQKYPTLSHYGAWILGGLAIWLISRGK